MTRIWDCRELAGSALIAVGRWKHSNNQHPGPLQSRFCFVGWKQWRLAGTRLHQLEPAAAIRGPHHGDVDSDAIEPDDVLHYRLPIYVPFVAHFSR